VPWFFEKYQIDIFFKCVYDNFNIFMIKIK
jgi:hypothetical protein